MGTDIGTLLVDLADRAKAWGERLAATYATGFLSGAVKYIQAAINWVANMIASFFKGKSPPETGPLSTIDKWGAAVMEAYLEGFKKADFSILSQVGSMIEQALTRGLDGSALANALGNVAAARMQLSELIDGFNDTGIIDESMLKKITNGLGPIADNVRELVSSWLEYNRIQERIAAIEERRKQVKRTYMDEIKAIAGSTMHIRDKVAAIRESQRARDDDLAGLNEEQEALEEQASEYKAQMEYQQALIDAMQTQDDLLRRIADTLKNLAEEMSGLEAGGGGFGDFEGGLPDPEIDLSDLDEQFSTIKERLTTGENA
jgi:hypothetical protein